MSYDSVDTLARFTAAHGITFTMLSDPDSETIERLGLLNQHVARQQAHFGLEVGDRHWRLPYPGVFLLDEDGIVVDKLFEASHQVRQSSARLVEDLFSTDLRPAVSARSATEGVTAAAWLTTATAHVKQLVRVHVTLDTDEGTHVYGAGSPSEYQPLEVSVSCEAPVETRVGEWPPPVRHEVEATGEVTFEHAGRVGTSIDVAIEEPGNAVPLHVDLRYQACTGTTCHPPESTRLTVSLQVLPHPDATP